MTAKTDGVETAQAEQPSLGRVRAQGARVGRDARTLAADLDAAVEDLGQLARSQLRKRPYTTLAAAGGVGWVLGGGVPDRLARLLLDQGYRLAVTMVVSHLAATILDGGSER